MKLICTSLLLILSNVLLAQIESTPKQYWNNQTHLNPAFAGLEHRLQAGAMYQNQWNYPGGSLSDIYGFYNMRVGKSWGLGIDMRRTDIGYIKSTSISLPVSYRIELNEENTLALGAGLEFGEIAVDATQFIVPGTGDPSTFKGKEKNLTTNAGVAFDNNWLTASFSANNIELTKIGDDELFRIVPTFLTFVRGKLPFGNESKLFKNSVAMLDVLHSYQNGFQQIQITARAQFRQRLTVFAGWADRSSFNVGGGWDFFQKLRATYSFEFSRSALTTSSNPAHEFALIYQLPVKK